MLKKILSPPRHEIHGRTCLNQPVHNPSGWVGALARVRPGQLAPSCTVQTMRVRVSKPREQMALTLCTRAC